MPDNEDFTDEPVRRPRGDDEDRRLPGDDDDDNPYERERSYDDRFRQRSWLEKELIKTNVVILVLFAFCCNGIALIVGIIGVVTCHDTEAKQKALILLIVGGVLTALGVGFQILSALAQ